MLPATRWGPRTLLRKGISLANQRSRPRSPIFRWHPRNPNPAKTPAPRGSGAGQHPCRIHKDNQNANLSDGRSQEIQKMLEGSRSIRLHHRRSAEVQPALQTDRTRQLSSRACFLSDLFVFYPHVGKFSEVLIERSHRYVLSRGGRGD